MNVLITGGAGFIGSHLTEALAFGGHHVRVLDNLSTGKRENLVPSDHIELIEGDIRDTVTVAKCFQGTDAVVHLAAVASVQASIDDPITTHHSNFDGTLNILEAARNNKVKHLLYASSAAVYGDTSELPVAEEVTPNPLSPYAADKLAGEHYLRYYASQYNLNAVAFRFFNIYGSRQDPSSPYSGVISIFSARAKNGQPVTVYGDGKQTRDFVFVKDLVAVLVEALARQDLAGQVINIGMGKEYSLLDLLTALEAILDKSIPRQHKPRRAGDIIRSRADITRLEKLLMPMPRTPLQTGLKSLFC